LDAGNAGSTFAWYPTGSTQTISATSTGTYSVLVTDAHTCTGTGTINVTINTPPAVSLGADVTQCGGNATLDAGNAGSTFAWYPTGSTQTISATSTGTYSVLVTDAHTCTGTGTVHITIGTIPTVTLTVTNAVCGNNNGSVMASAAGGSGVYMYSWNNGGTTSAITGLSGSPTETLIVTVTDDLGCVSEQDTALVNCTTAITEMNNGTGISIYPNPSMGQFHLIIESGQASTTIEQISIINALGEEVYSVTKGGQMIDMNLDIPAGIYFMRVKTDNAITVQKLIINK
jgi:hypothetical protein